MSPGFQVHQIDHVEFFVPDRRQAARWYEQALGLTVHPRYEHWAETSRGPLMITTPRGDTKLALFRGAAQEQRDTAGFHRVAFQVDADGFLAALEHLPQADARNEDGEPLERAEPVDHGRSWSVYFRDPWGHRLEITTYEHDRVARQRARTERDSPAG